MKISELPQDVKEKALEYQMNETRHGYNKSTDSIFVAFEWSETEEGGEYWNELHLKKAEPKDNTNGNTNGSKDFDEVIQQTLDRCKELLIIKGKEYRRNNDPFHNFNEGSKISGLIPEKVLDGFLLKHEISINDMTNDIEKGILPIEDKVNEKFDDNIIYLLIKKAMILNRIKQENNETNR